MRGNKMRISIMASAKKKYKEELSKVLDQMPENKIIELFDFAQSLMGQSRQ